ncbi:MAG TPA: hypothetical protein VLR94_11775, partial [Acidobacteriota bacterium]|nr:hypothetical protein [Acidobacteriota bacterium]
VGTATEGKAFTVNDKTTYTVDGKKSKLADLKAGQNVTIEADAQNLAHSIAATTATPAAK